MSEQTERAETKAAVKEAKQESKKQPEPVVLSTDGPAQMTLPELVGKLVEHVLTDPKQMPVACRDLMIWYNAQDPNNRKAISLDTKKKLEVAKSIAEGFFTYFMSAAHQDM